MTTLSPGPASLPVLPVPEVPGRQQRAHGGAVAFTEGHHFTLDSRRTPGRSARLPLRRCR